ncbi:hypothetical protein OSTOST_01451 [Ostertagia ostertagi]
MGVEMEFGYIDTKWNPADIGIRVASTQELSSHAWREGYPPENNTNNGFVSGISSIPNETDEEEQAGSRDDRQQSEIRKNQRPKPQHWNERYNLRPRRTVRYTDEQCQSLSDVHCFASQRTRTWPLSLYLKMALTLMIMSVVCGGHPSIQNQPSTRSSADYAVDCREVGVYLHAPQSQEHELCVNNYCVLEKTPPIHKLIRLPPEEIIHDFEVRWKLKAEDSYTVVETTCPAQPFCSAIDSTVCTAYVLNPECWPLAAITGLGRALPLGRRKEHLRRRNDILSKDQSIQKGCMSNVHEKWLCPHQGKTSLRRITITVQSRINTLYKDVVSKVVDSKRCSIRGSCIGNTCADVNATSLLPELKIGNNFPGITYCLESCGGPGCGCFHWDSGCLFYRIYAVPKDDTIYELYKCTTWDEEVDCECTPAENQVMCKCEEDEVEKTFLSIENALPVIRDQVQFSKRPHHAVVTKMEHDVSAEITLTLKEAATDLITEIKGGICTIENADITGCYQCSKGARDKITCTSTLSNTSAEVKYGNGSFTIPCFPTGVESHLHFLFDSARVYVQCSSMSSSKQEEEFTRKRQAQERKLIDEIKHNRSCVRLASTFSSEEDIQKKIHDKVADSRDRFHDKEEQSVAMEPNFMADFIRKELDFLAELKHLEHEIREAQLQEESERHVSPLDTVKELISSLRKEQEEQYMELLRKIDGQNESIKELFERFESLSAAAMKRLIMTVARDTPVLREDSRVSDVSTAWIAVTISSFVLTRESRACTVDPTSTTKPVQPTGKIGDACRELEEIQQELETNEGYYGPASSTSQP